MKDNIFGFTREELVDMFEPLSEIEEKVNDIVVEKTGWGSITSTADFKKNSLVWLQDKIEGTRMNKADKQQIIDWIGSTIGLAFFSGKAYQTRESGMMDEYIKSYADSRIAQYGNKK